MVVTSHNLSGINQATTRYMALPRNAVLLALPAI